MEDGTSPLCQVQTVLIAAQCFPAVKNAPNSKVVVPRMSMVYDVFGNGKTGLKFSANRYTERITTGYPTRISGIAVKSDTRSWTDTNKDSIPQLTELGPSTGFNLGTSNRYADGAKIPHVNELDAEFEQELPGQVVVSTGYYYRGYRDNLGSRNLLVPASGYTPITVTEKSSGATVTVYNQDPNTRNKFDTVFSNEPALDRTFNGVDLNIQKRMSHGWMLMGSVNYGKNVGDVGGDLNNPNFTFRRGVGAADDIPLFGKLSGAYKLPYGIRDRRQLVNLSGLAADNDRPRRLRYGQAHAGHAGHHHRAPRDEAFCQRQAGRPELQKGIYSGGMKIQPRVDIFNLLNANAVTTTSSSSGRPTATSSTFWVPAWSSSGGT